MGVAMVSVSEAASRLQVSPARVRQRIQNGSLVAQKIGGRWLVALPSMPSSPPRGRPVNPASVWWSILAIEAARASAAAPSDHAQRLISQLQELEARLSRSSRHRAARRISAAAALGDDDAVLDWLRGRAERRVFVAAEPDLDRLRSDPRVLVSGVSHPSSRMADPRVAEGYIDVRDLDEVVGEHWLDEPRPGQVANVILHIAPVRPVAVNDALLAADLAEHQGPRELARARELIAEWIAGPAPDGQAVSS